MLYNHNMMSTQYLLKQSVNYQRIAQVIEFLAENFHTQPNLEQIAASLGLSKYHFQRIFKNWAGVTPTQFLHYLTVEYAKDRLRESATILETALASGLSSPGRLHDLFVTFEAMSPGAYKQRGAGLDIHFGFHPTPFGGCLLALTERGICALHFLVNGEKDSAYQGLTQEWPQANFIEDPDRTGLIIAGLFPENPNDQPGKYPLFLRGTNFQVKVWQALLAIPTGGMVSYGELAALLGKPSAARAVAGAVARNPISYLIPCHRVITSVGDTHGYRWGVIRKKAMLGWEAAQRIGLACGAESDLPL